MDEQALRTAHQKFKQAILAEPAEPAEPAAPVDIEPERLSGGDHAA